MKLEFEPYVVICTGNVDIYDINMIIIDEEDKTIDCSDINGFTIAVINYENEEEVGYLEYDEKELLTGESYPIVKNGEIVVKEGGRCFYG